MDMNPEETNVIDPVYLPFKPAELRRHFMVDKNGQLSYYQMSARRYREFRGNRLNWQDIPITEARTPCQIEKDERFWTATGLKNLIDAPKSTEVLASLLQQAFGAVPPVPGFKDWTSCLSGQLELILEATLPSPESYVTWLRENLESRNLVPYVLRAAKRCGARTLEGATHVDAVIVNVDNGFSLLVEAKVLSDISGVVSFDVFRNQLVRNLDVLLEPSNGLEHPLHRRRPDASLFILLTPRYFKEQRHSRFYGWLFNEYTNNPASIGRDLPHRQNLEWSELSRKMGWFSFEEINSAIPGACPWLGRGGV